MRTWLILACVLWAGPVWATTYYVRTDGNNGNAGTANTSGGAWRTIDYAADHVSAGDTVRVQAGTYLESVTPGVSGTSGNIVTLVADGTVTTCQWLFSSRSYIRVIGFTMNPSTGGCTNGQYVVDFIGSNSYLEFWHNDLSRSNGDGFRNTCGNNFSNSLIIGNAIHDLNNVGYYGNGIAVTGTNNLVAYNTITTIDYIGIMIGGDANRIIGNVISGLVQVGGRHPDFYYFNETCGGYSLNVVETTSAAGTPSAGDNKWVWSENPATSATITGNIFRQNVVDNVGSGGHGCGSSNATYPLNYFRSYHNTMSRLVRSYASQQYGVAWLDDGCLNGSFQNELNYEAWGASATTVHVYYVQGGATITTIDYNLAYDPDGSVTFTGLWAGQAHPRSNSDPLVTSAYSDMTLSSISSGAYGTAGPLTTTNGSGTGTTFNVAANTGNYFRGDNTSLSQYGGGLIVGDTVTVGTDVVTVTSISGDAITVAGSFTWANGDPVYWGSDATPDIGAYPYKAGGYALSLSHSQSADVITVTPNDADLVRFVVCYENGVPVTVDETSPFSCTVGTGRLRVRAFPRYARTTTSTQASGTPASPVSVSIPSSLTPTLSWTHDRTNVTHFECAVDGGTAVSLGLPTPTSTTYTSALANCGTLSSGANTITIRACNESSCATSAALTVVKL